MQQYLPFTVLKPFPTNFNMLECWQLQQYLPFTVLKLKMVYYLHLVLVATVLTVYGIETVYIKFSYAQLGLQQYLPFTVLKLAGNSFSILSSTTTLQQYLPFTVLKHDQPPQF